MKTSIPLGFIIIFILLFQNTVVVQSKIDPYPERYKKEIANFEQCEVKNSFAKDAVPFVGSSSIRFWEIKNAFLNLPVINRGFGGSHISDVQHYYDQVIRQYNPSVIIFYAGNNDIAASKTIPQMVVDYKALTDKVLVNFTKAKFVYIPIKPNGDHLSVCGDMRAVNYHIKAYNKQHPRFFMLIWQRRY